MLAMFLDSQNFQLVNTLMLMLILGLCDILFRRYGQICEFQEEKGHLVAILKMLSMFLSSQNLQLVTTLLLMVI
jgi:hypothetical protein